MHKYILEKDNFYIAGAGFDTEGILKLEITADPDEALSLHFKKTIVQLRRLIKKTIKIRFNIVKVG